MQRLFEEGVSFHQSEGSIKEISFDGSEEGLGVSFD